MENQPKLNSNKAIIAFLAERFPLCFTAGGEARPLKIGIFQDLVKRVQSKDNISKTQLRSALRLYTSSWRYLYGITLGSPRVDLDGNLCSELETQHVEHAHKKLEEAKARVQFQRAAQQAKKWENDKNSALRHKTTDKRPAKSAGITERKLRFASRLKQERTAPAVRKTAQTTTTLPITNISTLQIGQAIKVKVGKDLMDATVMEIAKEEVRVQLSSGMALIVRTEHLQF